MTSTREIEWRRLPFQRTLVELHRLVETLHRHAIPTEEGLAPARGLVRACPN
jgi:hypothetical protein